MKNIELHELKVCKNKRGELYVNLKNRRFCLNINIPTKLYIKDFIENSNKKICDINECYDYYILINDVKNLKENDICYLKEVVA